MHLKTTKQMSESLNYRSPGSCCWTAFIKMGALRENSPNHTGWYGF